MWHGEAVTERATLQSNRAYRGGLSNFVELTIKVKSRNRHSAK